MKTGFVHSITERRSPINITVRCTCGWVHTETRRQNALARAAKVRAAIDKHNRDVWAKAAASPDKVACTVFTLERHGEILRWNITEMQHSAALGEFGAPQRLPVASLAPADWDNDNLSRSRVDDFKTDPKRLAEPVIIIESPPGSPFPLLVICDGQHRIVALQEMEAETFEAFIVPWARQFDFRLPPE